MFGWLRRKDNTPPDTREDDQRLIALRSKFLATQHRRRTASPSRPMLSAAELGELVGHGLISQLEADGYDTGGETPPADVDKPGYEFVDKARLRVGYDVDSKTYGFIIPASRNASTALCDTSTITTTTGSVVGFYND